MYMVTKHGALNLWVLSENISNSSITSDKNVFGVSLNIVIAWVSDNMLST